MEKVKNSEEYVLNHQFGYGKFKEKIKLNKLKLRNIDDLCVYVNDSVINAFDASYQNNVIQFYLDNSKCKIIIENI